MNRHLRVAVMLYLAASVILSVATFDRTQIPLGVAIVLSALWMISQLRSWHWGSDVSFVGLAALCVLSIYSDVALPLTFLALSLGLAAWDLSNFGHRLLSAAFIRNVNRLTQRHLERLGLTLAAGGLLSIVALNVEIQISFAMAVLLVLVLYFTVNQLIAANSGQRP
jgi:hypothetical protein